MGEITVTLNEDDIRAACMAWAVTRILNEGRAVGCVLNFPVCDGMPTGTINSVRVLVETDRMKDKLPMYISASTPTKAT